MGELCDALLREVAAHADDDIALLAVRVDPEVLATRQLVLPAERSAVAEARSFVQDKLLPQQQQTHDRLSALKDRL